MESRTVCLVFPLRGREDVAVVSPLQPTIVEFQQSPCRTSLVLAAAREEVWWHCSMRIAEGTASDDHLLWVGGGGTWVRTTLLSDYSEARRWDS